MLRPSRFSHGAAEHVKDFYRNIEDYDWIPVTDRFRGPESFLHRFRERETLRLLARHGGAGPLLDVGCGTGLILRHLPRGSTGLDINPRYLAKARLHAPDAVLVQGDAEALPFADGAFGTVVCTEVLEHVPDPAQAVAEIRRVLSPEGVLIGSTPRRSLLWRLRFLSSTHYRNEPFHHEYRTDELRSLFDGWQTLSLQCRFFGGIFFFALRRSAD